MIVFSAAIGILLGVGLVIYARSSGNGEGAIFVLLGFCGLVALAGAVQFTRFGRTARVEQALAAGGFPTVFVDQANWAFLVGLILAGAMNTWIYIHLAWDVG